MTYPMSNKLVLSMKTPARPAPPVSAPVSPAAPCVAVTHVQSTPGAGGVPSCDTRRAGAGSAKWRGAGSGCARKLHGVTPSSRSMMSVMVQVGGTALVLRVGRSSSHLPHLPPASTSPPDMLAAQVHSVPSVSARSGQRGPGACLHSHPQSQPCPPHFLISKGVCSHILGLQFPPNPLLGLSSIPTPPRLHQTRTHPMPITQPNSNLILQFSSAHAPHQLQSHPHPSPPRPCHTLSSAAVRTHLGCTRTLAEQPPAPVGLPARLSGGYRCSAREEPMIPLVPLRILGILLRCLVEERTC